MHPHDKNCRWCGFGPLMIDVPSAPGMMMFNPHACPAKPPMTAEEGAAVAFGLLGMAQEIACNPNVEACPICGIAPRAWVSEPVTPYFKRCRSCYDAEVRK